MSSLPGIEINEKNIVSSTGALSFDKVPKCSYWGRLCWIGNGICLVKIRFKVTVIEYLGYVTPGMDREVSNEFQKILTKQRSSLKWDQS